MVLRFLLGGDGAANGSASACPTHAPPPPPPDWGGGGDGAGNPLPDSVWMLGWAVCGFLALFAVVVSLSLIGLHLANFSRPALQRHVVRILFMVPSYAICAFVSYRFPSASIYINVYRDCCKEPLHPLLHLTLQRPPTDEGFAVYSFFNLCLCYLGRTWEEQRASVRGNPRRFPPPLCCAFYDPRGPNFLVFCKLGIVQLVLVRIFTSSFTVYAELEGIYCPESMSPQFGHFWAVLLNSIGMGLSMFTLLTFYLAVHEDLPGGRPVYQFLSIKYVLFVSYIQTMVLQALVAAGRIRGDTRWTAAELVNAVASSLTCLEMAVAAVLNVAAFPPAEFARPRVVVRPDGELVVNPPKPGLVEAVADACRPDDLWEDAVVVLDSVLGWVGLSTGLRRGCDVGGLEGGRGGADDLEDEPEMHLGEHRGLLRSASSA
ncbi:hypothetical protein HK405_009246 [Cladochytrium tenue]|nr:hypothetical protein HK405_009246 [Cladochytrium tenue]